MLSAVHTNLSPEQLLAGWLAELINVFIYVFLLAHLFHIPRRNVLLPTQK